MLKRLRIMQFLSFPSFFGLRLHFRQKRFTIFHFNENFATKNFRHYFMDKFQGNVNPVGMECHNVGVDIKLLIFTIDIQKNKYSVRFHIPTRHAFRIVFLNISLVTEFFGNRAAVCREFVFLVVIIKTHQFHLNSSITVNGSYETFDVPII